MLSANVLCKELISRGYLAEKKDLSLDDGKSIPGIVIETGDINQCIPFPVKFLLNNAATIEDAANVLQEWTDMNKLPDGLNIDRWLTKENVLKTVHICLEERQWNPCIWRDSIFPGVIEICYFGDIYRNQLWSVEVRKETLDELGITIEELWEQAQKNTFRMREFKSLAIEETLGKRMFNIVKDKPVKHFYTITNELGPRGAVQVLNLESMKYFQNQTLSTEFWCYFQNRNICFITPDFPDCFEMLKLIAENDGDKLLSYNLYKIKVTDSIELLETVPFDNPYNVD